jgi:hypothetical protein
MRWFPSLLLAFTAIATATASCGGAAKGNASGAGAANASTSNAGAGGAPSAGSGSGNAASMGAGATDTGGSIGALVGVGSGGSSGNGTGGGGTCPAYKTCEEQGLNCGKATDGCGNPIECGTCTAPETCAGGGTQNVCGMPPCNKQTCATQNFDCGMASDQCGGTLDCGTCPAGQTCGATSSNVCGAGVCMAQTCAQQGFNCGMQGDGCGNTIDCGTCTGNQVCGGGANPQNGVCGTPVCTPKTCAEQGFNCGMATDGCGNVIDCSGGMACPAGEICGGGGPNVCGGNGCAMGTSLVYVWALDGNIYSFDPPSKTFTFVATPDCLASNPNSMAIDRNLNAWLNYLTPGSTSPNDYIYKFSLTTKTGCTPSGITIPPGFNQVGMGFSSDTPGGTTETLYVDGIGGAGLASVNMTTKTINPIGTFSNDVNLEGQSCELTGTGNALLFGYFTTSPYVRVAQLNKTNSNSITDNVLTGFTPPDDWAFSFWGGNFYLYAYPNASNSPNSSVIQWNPNTNALNLAYVANVGFTIIGAGVSTCAPTCTPQTCTQANAACGPATDGCGNIIQCGTCPAGEACVDGACTTGCTAKTCTGQGFMCGMQGDGCGNAINCGICPAGDSCSAGTCTKGTCTPKSCSTLGYACGSVGDGCGNLINCGTCPSGQICGGQTPGQCYTPPCTAKTCAQQGFNCGSATNGCGAIIDCGTCTGSATCGRDARVHRAPVALAARPLEEPALLGALDEAARGRLLGPQVVREVRHAHAPVAQDGEHAELGERAS